MNHEREPDQNGATSDVELENRLRAVLRREDAPAGLTERILARAREQPAAPRRGKPPAGWLQRFAPALSACALFLLVCALVTVGLVRRHRSEARQAQEARARLVYALQVTTGALDWAERQVNAQAGEPSGAAARPAHEPKSAERL